MAHDLLIAAISISIASEYPLIFAGATNLPDGTLLALTLRGEQPKCIPHCGLSPHFATVEGGKFEVDLSSALEQQWGTKQLASNFYSVEVTTVAANGQSPKVQAIIGRGGEYLRGPYVRTLKNGTFAPVNFPWTPDPNSYAYLVGLSIDYNQRIVVSPAGKINFVR